MRRGGRVGTFSDPGGRRLRGGPVEADGGGGGIISRGTLPPGLITDSALNGAQLSTQHIRFARQNFAFDDTIASSIAVNGNTGWNRVCGSGQLKLSLGVSADPFVAYVWGSYSWENDDASAATGFATLVLYQGTDTDDDGVSDSFVTYQRLENFVINALPADARARTFAPFGLFVVPAVDGVEWFVGMQNHVGSAGNLSNQKQRAQTLMAFTCAFDVELDSGLVTDATLE